MLNLIEKIYRLFRFIISGYIFKRKKIYKKLSEFQGEDWNVEKTYKLKMVLYSVIVGNYDHISPPPILDGIDCYLVTNLKNVKNLGWKVIDIEDYKGVLPKDCSQVELSRYFKFHPEVLFSDYDYSMYIDGNIEVCGDIKPIFYKMEEENKVICMHKHSARDCIYEEGKIIYALGRAKYKDIARQLKKYKSEGMPKHFGLFENNIIARKHNDLACHEIMSVWWDEYRCGCKRDQLSFVYSLWKLGHDISFVKSMGSNSRNNPLFKIVSHQK